MNYGYVRVSTKEQNIDRQMEDMYNQGLTDDCIFIDKQSGKSSSSNLELEWQGNDEAVPALGHNLLSGSGYCRG